MSALTNDAHHSGQYKHAESRNMWHVIDHQLKLIFDYLETLFLSMKGVRG